MNLFLSILLTAGFVATSVATDMADTVVLKGQSVKGVARDRILKGAKKSKTKTKKSVESNCPPLQAYMPPERCSDTCYSNVTTMFSDINNNIQKGTPFEGTLCQGTHNLLVDVYVEGTVANVDVTLHCCGPKNSCIIDGGGPTNIRDYSVFRFESTVQKFVVEGIKYQNFKFQYDSFYNLYRQVLQTNAASVVTIRHVTFESVYSYSGVALHFSYAAVATIEGCSFTNNHAELEGGAIYAYDSIIKLNGNTFFGNTAEYLASAISAYGSSIELNGNTFFDNTVEHDGGAMYVVDSAVVATCNTFEQNHVGGYGGAAYGSFSDLEFSYNVFKENTATEGGAIYVSHRTMTSFANTFTNNTADVGGAIYGELIVMKSDRDIFTSNSITDGSKLAVIKAAKSNLEMSSSFTGGKHADINSATDKYSSGAKFTPVGIIPSDFGPNIYLYGSVFEFKCKSPIPGTTLEQSIAFDSCI